MTTAPPPCPQCGAPDVVPILYGYTEDPATLAAVDRGELVLRRPQTSSGCRPFVDAPYAAGGGRSVTTKCLSNVPRVSACTVSGGRQEVIGGAPLTSFAEEVAPHFPALSRTDRQSRFTATVGSSRYPAAQRHAAERSPPVAAAQEPSRLPRKIRWPDTSARRRGRSRGSRPLERTRCGPPRHDGSRAALAAHTC